MRLSKPFFALALTLFIQPLTFAGTQFMANPNEVHPVAATDQDAIVTVPSYDMQRYDQKLQNFFTSHHADKLSAAIKLFLDQPYVWEPLGEGPDAAYSQEPIYRTDKFDCVAFVDTILSLMHSNSLDEFKKNILLIRYHQGKVAYQERTDWFTDLEWIPNAQQLGWIKEATFSVVDDNNQPIAKMASTLIDKPNWYQVKPLKAMHRFAPVPTGDEAEKLLQSLHAHYVDYSVQPSTMSYLPLDKLFNKDGSANEYYFKQIPSPAVVAVARPNWQIRDEFPGFPHGYGTNLNVSHLGLAVRTEKDLMFCHASSVEQKVVCEPLKNYLGKYIDSPTIKGIHIETML